MQTRSLLLALAATVVLLGCANLEGVRPGNGRPVPLSAFETLKCPSGNCPVSVTFDAKYVNSNNTCGVHTPEVVYLGGLGGGRSRLILWIISDSNYNFASTPLDKKGDTTFFGDPETHGPVLQDRVTVANPGLSHEYGLKIVKTDGTACSTYDPWMIE